MKSSDLSDVKAAIKLSPRTIVVAGTGLSLALTCGKYTQLSWGGLIKHGFEYAVKYGLTDSKAKEKWISILEDDAGIDDMLAVADVLCKKLNAPEGLEYSRWLTEAFSDVKINNPSLMQTIRKASDSGVRFCTLNYDSILEDATGLPGICISDTDDVINWIKGDKKAILHLHGSWKIPQSCIFSDADYNKAISDKPRDFFQRNIIVLEQLLYVGCGGTFEDPNFQNVLKWLNEDLQSNRVPGIALVAAGEIPKRRIEWRGLVQPMSYGAERSELPLFLEKLFSELVADPESAKNTKVESSSISSIEEGVKRLNLDSLRIVMAPAHHALTIRHALLYRAGQLMARDRLIWVAADLGMLEDEFIWALISQADSKREKVFELNVGNCTKKGDLERLITDLLDSPFHSFLTTLSDEGNSYLILRDIPFDDVPDKDALRQEFQRTATILTSFCEDLKVILTSRQASALKGNVVELVALDAADTRAYIQSHELYQGGLGRDDFQQLYERTSGIPRLIYQYIEKLSVASLDEITIEGESFNIDLPGRFGDSIQHLASSDDIKLKYAYSLLKYLSVFPHGEYLENIKRINKNNKFTSEHALVLQQHGLIYVENQDRFGHLGARATKKRLVATRAVRQWLSKDLKKPELARLRKAAYQLYFGENWELKRFKLHPTFKSDQLGEKSSEVNNARTFIADLFAASNSDTRTRIIANELASHFFALMTKKTYYKAVHDLYASLSPWFNTGPSGVEYWYLDFLHARALRMSGADGAREEALAVLLASLPKIRDNKTLASAELPIALIYSRMKDRPNAILYAKKVQKHTRGIASLQASHIILENSDSIVDGKELIDLQAKAKKSKAIVTYANISLDRLKRLPDNNEKLEELRQLVDYCDQTGNSYGKTRATLDLADAILKVENNLDAKLISELIGIYHHLHNDDLMVLHAQCHEILWKVFLLKKDILNLLQLFKYSSLFWRLREKDQLELDAVNTLRTLSNSAPFSGSERDSALSYYLGRATTLLT